MASSAKFLDEVCDQFLTCKVCSRKFRNPKALSCLHTFCCECIEKCYEAEEQQRRPYRFLLYARAISCPVCNAKTDVPTGGISRLPDNSFLDELCQMVSRSTVSTVQEKLCEICKNCKENYNESLAVTKCMDCSKCLCLECTNRHKSTKVTQLHSLFKLDVEHEIHCKIHLSEMIKYFCESCDECICILCAFQHHKNHEVCLISEVVEDGRISLQNILKECEDLIAKMNAKIKFINDHQVYIKENEDKIRECVTELVSLIRQKERDSISLLKNSKETKVTDEIADKEILENDIHKLETAYKQANKIMKGNNIEVMLAKKIMKEQINFASNHSNLNIPASSATEDLECDFFLKLLKIFSEKGDSPKSIGCDQSVQTDEIIKSSQDAIQASKIEEVSKNKLKWQKTLPLVEVIQQTIFNPVIVWKVAEKQVATKTKDAFTEMPRLEMSDKSIATNKVCLVDKETTTFKALVMHKNVSTINQTTADKSTSTSNDGSVIQRTLANIKRQITVSRGTMTQKSEKIQRSTSPLKFNEDQMNPSLTFVAQVSNNLIN